MSDFLQYLKAKENTSRARAEYNYASLDLDLAKIMERRAEIKSQAAPMDELLNYIETVWAKGEMNISDRSNLREQVIWLIDYVVMNKKFKQTEK